MESSFNNIIKVFTSYSFEYMTFFHAVLHFFLERDVINTSRAYAMMPVRPSVCDGSALVHYS